MANILAAIGSFFSAATTTFSWWWIAEETECPKSLIK